MQDSITPSIRSGPTVLTVDGERLRYSISVVENESFLDQCRPLSPPTQCESHAVRERGTQGQQTTHSESKREQEGEQGTHVFRMFHQIHVCIEHAMRNHLQTPSLKECLWTECALETAYVAALGPKSVRRTDML